MILLGKPLYPAIDGFRDGANAYRPGRNPRAEYRRCLCGNPFLNPASLPDYRLGGRLGWTKAAAR